MLLGTRARPRRDSMKRTTSMSEFSLDDLAVIGKPNSSTQQDSDDIDRQALVNKLMQNRRSSADFSAKSSATFLRTCSLCRRRLTSGRDIFMYRGDTAFCSSDCREQKMAQDEWREKCGIGSSTNKESNSTTSPSTLGRVVPPTT